ncbi:MAG: sugar ABC transporter ATP-binding protein [Elusimicrobia bacterium HGW-Elusimicrobia-2]|nr:MAG: sugar ABC transporter ATP-binding protein [Elusimicrobia bacterium HGW-Elusimicrobia-2]
MAEVILKNIAKIYKGDVVGCKDINLHIKDREFCVLVGPSGCGKSTTLRLIAGLEDITEGELRIGDRIVNDIPPKERDIAMVFQNYALYPHMKVWDNLAFGLKLRKYPADEIKKRVTEAARILEIEHLLERRPKALSGGQRQRVALGRAIVRKPKVFLFDEPLSNLDAKLRVQMRVEIKKLHAKLQITSIYVTHDQIEAMTMGDRIVVMKDGFIQQVDDPMKLYERPVSKFVAGFIGSPPINLIKVKISRDGEKFLISEAAGGFKLKYSRKGFDFLAAFSGKNLIMGVRPENIIDRIYAGVKEAENTVPVVVEAEEPMGSENYIHLKTVGGSEIVMKTEGSNRVKPGDRLELIFNAEKMHFFHPDTEKRINEN